MTEEEVRALLDKYNLTWEDFLYWMRGQTTALGEDGETLFYKTDVMMFVGHNE